MEPLNFEGLFENVVGIQTGTKTAASRSVDRLLTLRNWLIGASVVSYEQHGADRATYGEGVIDALAGRLKRAGRQGLSSRNILNYRQFALAWPGLEVRGLLDVALGSGARLPIPRISQTVSAKSPVKGLAGSKVAAEVVLPSLVDHYTPTPELAWRNADWFQRLFTSLSFSMLLELGRIEEPLKRGFYEVECLRERWSLREFKRQRNSMLYERIGLSRDKDALMALSREGVFLESPTTLLRDPYVLEFLGMEKAGTFKESELEQKLIDHLQAFLHELGRDFCFVERQHRVTVGGRHHFLDLLFYHRSLRCLIAIDLKVGTFRHEYAGQMHFYLNYLADQVAHPDENPPIGLLLCADKDVQEVHYATAGLKQSVFVSRYLLKLPSEEQLTAWLREEQSLLEGLIATDNSEED